MNRTKYPRTLHFPWSPGKSNDDKVIKSLDAFKGHRVILTEKMDGENTTMYSDYVHARSLDSAHHESRSWVKRLSQEIGYKIPYGYRVCGENLYAKHSVAYDNLSSYFYAFSVWTDDNWCLGWDKTVDFLNEIGLIHVPVLYDGIFDEDKIKEICLSLDMEKQEGAVLRVAHDFSYSDFGNVVAKYVRADHVQTDEHWMQAVIVPNKLS